MRRDDSTCRGAGPTAATTLMAILAVAMVMPVAPIAVSSAIGSNASGPGAGSEHQAMRAVAAAVVAAARDLLAGQPVRACLPAPAVPAAPSFETTVARAVPVGDAPPRCPVLDERLLDLPPPAG